MTPLLTIDPAAFVPDAAPEGTVALNERLMAQAAGAPDTWSIGPAAVRERRKLGLSPFIGEPKSARAEIMTIPGPGGPLQLRVIAAPAQATGVYLHIHGGGWTFGSADQDDPRLDRFAANLGLACVSVEYRLAPENPYPAAPDDCEAAALWLIREAKQRFGVERLLIGGESAGAHLAVVTLLRLRDQHGLTPFSRANLTAGCFDLGLTPSARSFQPKGLVLGARDLRMFVAQYLQGGEDRQAPDVSPLYGDLAKLPPTIFTVGGRDPLVDDTLFMAARWAAAGNQAELAVWPGSPHVHIALPDPQAEPALERIEAFLEG
ncbi:alpha/beta hydrolase [Methylopila sp. 73B]|uniref:alpha/beta hydrolase n=1 Tax=Methylopila sp. 73B TaxID=1120792 RepID=UPI00035CF112|nr:alpha/beta hydrolase [Methylopila sp. 73B]